MYAPTATSVCKYLSITASGIRQSILHPQTQIQPLASLDPPFMVKFSISLSLQINFSLNQAAYTVEWYLRICYYSLAMQMLIGKHNNACTNHIHSLSRTFVTDRNRRGLCTHTPLTPVPRIQSRTHCAPLRLSNSSVLASSFVVSCIIMDLRISVTPHLSNLTPP